MNSSSLLIGITLFLVYFLSTPLSIHALRSSSSERLIRDTVVKQKHQPSISKLSPTDDRGYFSFYASEDPTQCVLQQGPFNFTTGVCMPSPNPNSHLFPNFPSATYMQIYLQPVIAVLYFMGYSDSTCTTLVTANLQGLTQPCAVNGQSMKWYYNQDNPGPPAPPNLPYKDYILIGNSDIYCDFLTAEMYPTDTMVGNQKFYSPDGQTGNVTIASFDESNSLIQLDNFIGGECTPNESPISLAYNLPPFPTDPPQFDTTTSTVLIEWYGAKDSNCESPSIGSTLLPLNQCFSYPNAGPETNAAMWTCSEGLLYFTQYYYSDCTQETTPNQFSLGECTNTFYTKNILQPFPGIPLVNTC